MQAQEDCRNCRGVFRMFSYASIAVCIGLFCSPVESFTPSLPLSGGGSDEGRVGGYSSYSSIVRRVRHVVPSATATAPLPPAATMNSSPSLSASTSSSVAEVSRGSPSASPASTSSTASTTTGSTRANLNALRRDVDNDVAQALYEDMLLGRIFEDMVAQMYYRGRVAGFVHLYNGQEAVSTGVIKAMRKDDYISSTYRDHVHALSKGLPPREVMAELYGKVTGCSKGRGGSMHMFSKEYNMLGGFAFISENIPIALGAAFTTAYRRQQLNDESADQVTAVFLGDGASNNGIFYECLNMAALARLPIIFVVENNNWAIGMAAARSTAVPEIHKRAEGFGVPGVEVDGMDVLAVRNVARQAVDRARRGEGPTVIEALTYRFRGHSLADPDELRAPLEKEAYLTRDPITSFEKYMKEKGYATDFTLKQTQKKVRAIIDDAVKFSESSPDPNVEDVGKYIFADAYQPSAEDDKMTPQQLNNYAKALAAELDMVERKKKGEKIIPPPVYLERNPLTIID